MIPEILKGLSLATISICWNEQRTHIYTDSQPIVTRGLWLLVSAALVTMKVELQWETNHRFRLRHVSCI